MKSQNSESDASAQQERQESDELLQRPLKRTPTSQQSVPPNGIVVGTLVDIDTAQGYLVDYPLNPEKEPQPAASLQQLGNEHIGQPIAISFINGQTSQPLILGAVYNQPPLKEEPSAVTATVDDDESLVFTAKKNIELRCGDARIIMTKAGKVLVEGKYVVSKSKGTNRILGGSVQLN